MMKVLLHHIIPDNCFMCRCRGRQDISAPCSDGHGVTDFILQAGAHSVTPY